MKKSVILILTLIIATAITASGMNGNLSIFQKAPRNIKAGEEFIVDITFFKDNISGFSKYEVTFPHGSQIVPLVCGNATFMHKDDVVKFIWIDLPDEESFSISYKVKIPEYYSGDEKICASFHYIFNKEKISQRFCTMLHIEGEKRINIPVVRNIEKNYDNIFENYRYAGHNVVFKVQLAAMSKPATPEYIDKLVHNSYRVKEEFTAGLYKYYVGQFYSLDAAELFRNICGVKDAFVVAYYKGERISIGEAKKLMSQSEE